MTSPSDAWRDPVCGCLRSPDSRGPCPVHEAALADSEQTELLGRLDEIRRDVGLEALLSGVASLMASEANKWQGAHEWAVLTAARHKIEDAEAEVARLWRDD